MAKTSAQSASNKKAPAQPKTQWLMILMLLLIGITFLPTTIIVVFGMIPTMVVAISINDTNGYASMTVGPMNVCGLIIPVIDLWKAGHEISQSFFIISQPFTWTSILVATALGWFFLYAIPPIIGGMSIVKYQMRLKDTQKEQEKLIKEWGQKVTGKKQNKKEPLLD